MLELRWVLLSLGLLLVTGVYLWTRFLSKKHFKSNLDQSDQIPIDNESLEITSDDFQENFSDDIQTEKEHEQSKDESSQTKIISLRFVPKNDKTLNFEQTVLALQNAELERGKYGIFHYLSNREENDTDVEFSVANLVEPGSFDLVDIKDNTLTGMTFFMILPGQGDPIARFDRMVFIARELKQLLEAELLDEEGSSWSVQRERYVREEIIQYCHQNKKTSL
jgi:FtsZ-interacting cell division protein ZipA|tara:strand:+ start:715 stop:1380 length:666 start_codon:yes stop_codon:yes gene_type:complete